MSFSDLIEGVSALHRTADGADLLIRCAGAERACHSLILRLRCPKLLEALQESVVAQTPIERRRSSGRTNLTARVVRTVNAVEGGI
eukprot:1864742-Prymnesium_polylepis.1